jgi:nicotinamide riboside kinase
MFNAFKKALDDYNRPYILLTGDKETRLKAATEAIDEIITQKKDLYSYSESLK